MTAQSTGFRDRTPSSTELDDLILIELAIRDQARFDESRRSSNESRHLQRGGINVREVVAHEGWKVASTEVDLAVRRLTSLHLMSTDRDPKLPGIDGCCAKLSTEGHARAAAVAPRYLGGPLRSFQPDNEMFDGIGQIEIEFLGERFVLGCVEGEEDQAIRFADRFAVDAGEVLKAVTGDLDHTRVMLMAGILAHGRIGSLERGDTMVPASDRIVDLDHNAPDYIETVTALEALIVIVRESNSYREEDKPDQERRLAELEAGRALLRSRWISLAVIKATIWGTLTYLAAKFVDAPIGEVASIAWSALKKLLGIG